MEFDELLCLELWCLNNPGYFLSKDCSLLERKCHQSVNALRLICKWCLHFKNIYCSFMNLFAPLQLFLFQLQLQHDSTELHVKVVSPLQFSLIMLTNVQSMPEKKRSC